MRRDAFCSFFLLLSSPDPLQPDRLDLDPDSMLCEVSYTATYIYVYNILHNKTYTQQAISDVIKLKA